MPPVAHRDMVGLRCVNRGGERTTARPMKVRDVIMTLMADGWHLVRQRGSHRQFKHPWKQGVVTVAGKLSDELARGTLRSVLKQAGLRP